MQDYVIIYEIAMNNRNMPITWIEIQVNFIHNINFNSNNTFGNLHVQQKDIINAHWNTSALKFRKMAKICKLFIFQDLFEHEKIHKFFRCLLNFFLNIYVFYLWYFRLFYYWIFDFWYFVIILFYINVFEISNLALLLFELSFL